MAHEKGKPYQAQPIHVIAIFVISLGSVLVMWRLKTYVPVLIVFGAAWVFVVTVYAWDLSTRAARLDALVRARTEELEAANHQLAAANEALRRLDAMKDWFVSSVSHELRAPVTNIRSFAEILSDYQNLEPEEHQEFARIICEESERLSTVIDEVLDRARIARDGAAAHPARLAVDALVTRCCTLFSHQAQQRGIQFFCTAPAELPPVFADEISVMKW